jgi:NAD+-dependent secondary alcohol dehydrogenase Adh1
MTPAEVVVVDPSEQALELAREVGADQTLRVDGHRHVDALLEMTEGLGAEAIIDFVGEKGAIEDGIEMVRNGGFYYVIGYGENLNIPTIDVISREISFIGNLVGTYADLVDLMTLTHQSGRRWSRFKPRRGAGVRRRRGQSASPAAAPGN